MNITRVEDFQTGTIDVDVLKSGAEFEQYLYEMQPIELTITVER